MARFEFEISFLFAVIVTLVVIFPTLPFKDQEAQFGLLRALFGSTLPDWAYAALAWLAWAFSASIALMLGWLRIKELVYRGRDLSRLDTEINFTLESMISVRCDIATGRGNPAASQMRLETLDAHLTKLRAEKQRKA